MNTSNWEKEFESFDPSKPAAVIRENLQFLKEGEHDHGDLVVAEEAISDCIKSFIRSLLTSERTKIREMVENRFKEVPSSVQCRVAIDCKFCQGRTDVSYHDALSDILTALQAGDNDKTI